MVCIDQVQRKLSDVVYNTLLELYLNEIGTCLTEERVTKEMRALELLKRTEVCACVCLCVLLFVCIYLCVCVCHLFSSGYNWCPTQATYDLDHALVLAQMHDFKDGILYLYEKAGLYVEIIRFIPAHTHTRAHAHTYKVSTDPSIPYGTQ